MKGKGKQFVPHGRKVMMAFPGGAGYGAPSDRDTADVRRDLAGGYISEAVARDVYGLSQTDIDAVMLAVQKGEAV